MGAVDQQGDLDGEIQLLGAQPGADPTVRGRPWAGSVNPKRNRERWSGQVPEGLCPFPALTWAALMSFSDAL